MLNFNALLLLNRLLIFFGDEIRKTAFDNVEMQFVGGSCRQTELLIIFKQEQLFAQIFFGLIEF